MTVYCIIGDRGSGKTIFLTEIAVITSRTNKQIVSNYNLKLLENIIPFHIKDIYDEKYRKCLILIDEAYLFADSRRSQSQSNLLLSYLALQSRKLQSDLYFALIKEFELDIRLREEIDVFIYPVFVEDLGFLYTIVDVKSKNQKQLFIPLDMAKKFYKYYDTYEIVKSDNVIPTSERESIAKDHIDSFIDFTQDYNSKITKEITKFYCRKNSLPLSIAEDLYYLTKKELRGVEQNE